MKLLRQASTSNLGQRAVRAGAWNLALNVSMGILSLVRVVVLARLLAPSDFGLFAIALASIAAFDALTQTGFDAALIQKQSNINDYLDTVWVVQLVRGVLIALALFVLAQPVATWFGEADAVTLLQVMAIVPLLKGFENVGALLLPRELEFDKQFRLSISEIATDIVVSIGVALIWRDALALIVGLAAGRAMRVLLSYNLHGYRPRLRFQLSKFRELQRFGRWVFFNKIIYFVALRGDKVLIAKLLGPALLGVYEIAWRISEVATRSFSAIAAEVVFPTYAKIQDDRSRLQKAYLMVLEAIAPVVIPCGMILTVLARPLGAVILGPDWLPIVAVLPLLAWSGVIRSISATGGSLFYAVGKPSIEFTINIIRVVVTFGLMVPLVYRNGLEGAAQAVLLGTITVVPNYLYWVKDTTGLSIGRLLLAFVPAIGLTVVVVIPAWVLLPVMSRDSLATLVSVALCMAGSYLAVSMLLWKRFHCGPLAHLSGFLKPANS